MDMRNFLLLSRWVGTIILVIVRAGGIGWGLVEGKYPLDSTASAHQSTHT